MSSDDLVPGRHRAVRRSARHRAGAVALVAALGVLVVVAATQPRIRVVPTQNDAARRPAARPAAGPSGAVASSPGPPAAPSAAVQRPSCAARALARMSVNERAGQVVMAGIPASRPDAAAEAVGRYHLGGVFLAGRSTASQPALRRRIDALQAAAGRAGPPVHVAVDQEGGKVQTLTGAGFPVLPSAAAQGRWPSPTLAEHWGRWAAGLARAGVTMNLAPVADTVPAGFADRNPPIGAVDRHYGTSPGAVAADVGLVVAALQRARILATAKHFPGLGRVRVNTDAAAGAVDPVATVADDHLEPFRAAVDAGAGAVMMSSASYPRLDARRQAVFSGPVVTDLLRRRLGFTGVVISDDVGAAGAVRSTPLGRRAVRFLAAGGDLVLTVRTRDAAPLTRALIAEARRSAVFAERLASAAQRVLASKERIGLLTCR